MADHLSGFVVTLEKDMHPDDAKNVIAAIQQIRGVIDVRPVVADIMNGHFAEQRVRQELLGKIIAIVKN